MSTLKIYSVVSGGQAGPTSDDGQLGIDGDLPLAVLSHTLVDVLIAWRPERLDSEHGTGALIELDGLQEGQMKQQKTVKALVCVMYLAANANSPNSHKHPCF